jgi:hypothetical protein
MIRGYVRKRVKLRISNGLRAVVLAAGISRRVFSNTRVISIAIIVIYTALTEKIGTPLIKSSTRSSASSKAVPSRRKQCTSTVVARS